ncbi:heparin lyase I family protein, partial [bacterium]|nr:heparin lyase I family protein [bacterium]
MKIFNLIAALLLLTVLAAPANATLESNTGYESGLENDGNPMIGVVEAYSDRIEASQNYARVGSWSLRTELRYGDETSVGCRAECNVRYTGTPAEEPVVERGVNKFYGFALLLDPGEGNYDYDTNGDIIMQSKQTSSEPHFHLMTDEGKFKYVHQSITQPHTDGYFATYEKGIWYDFVLDHLPSYDSSGHLKLYYKKATDNTYAQVLDYSGATLLWDKGGYSKWGIYKSTWASGPT